MARSKTKAANVAVPQSKDEADDYIVSIGDAQRALMLLKAAQDEQMAAVKKSYADEAAPLVRDVADLTEGLRLWCEANRGELTGKGKTKTARFASGEVSWRNCPPTVTIKAADKVIERIRQHRLFQFLRTTVSIDKEAMLADKDTAAQIAGVSIKSAGEDFIVKPFEAPLGDAPRSGGK